MVTREDWHPYIRSLALAVLLVVIATWDRPSPTQSGMPAMPVTQEEPATPNLTKQQLLAAREQCRRKSEEEFRRAWKEGAASTAGWKETAEFVNHYNEKMDVCFYLLAIVRHSPAADEAILLRKMLYDVNDGELYGEYRGPEQGGTARAGLPNVCRMAGLYCASGGEWDLLAEPFMEAGAPTP